MVSPTRIDQVPHLVEQRKVCILVITSYFSRAVAVGKARRLRTVNVVALGDLHSACCEDDATNGRGDSQQDDAGLRQLFGIAADNPTMPESIILSSSIWSCARWSRR